MVALSAQLAGCATTQYERLPTLAFEALVAPAPVKRLPLGEGESAVEVAYVDEGQGPLIVLVHGLGEHLGYWSENFGPLVAQGFRVVALDLPGFGRSGKPRTEYGMAEQAGWLSAFLSAVAPETPAVVVGHSMGGQVAMRLALDAPELVRGLCLVAPAGIERFSSGEAEWLKANTGTVALARQDEAQIRAHYRRNLYRQWVPAAEHHLEERVRLRGAKDFDAYLYAVVRSIHGMLDGPVADELVRLPPTLPVTVVFGEDDAMIPNPFLHGGATASVAREAQALMPGALVRTLPGVGHMVQVEAPVQTNALIAALARAPSASAP